MELPLREHHLMLSYTSSSNQATPSDNLLTPALALPVPCSWSMT